MTYFIGVDIAKFTHYACIMNDKSHSYSNPFPFENSLEGFKLLLSHLDSIPKDEVLFGFESTAHYHLNLSGFLSDNGYSFKLLNPIITNRFRGLSIRNIKTDAVDAKSIATYLAFDDSKSHEFDVHTELDSLCKRQRRIKEDITRRYIRLTMYLDIVFPEFKPFIKNLKTMGVHELLKYASSAFEINKTRVDKIQNLLNSKKTCCSREKASAIKSLAEHSVGLNCASDAQGIKDELYQIELLESQLQAIESQLITIVKEIDTPLLKIPGMGYIQAAIILAAIQNISRFDSSSKLLAYAGLDPVVRQSGLFQASNTRMSKRGNKMLRYALIWAAHNLVRNSNKVKEYYSKKRSEGKSHYNALGHCAKKLVNYIYYVLKNPDKDFILE